MTETHVVSALRSKRAEISGQMREMEKNLHRMRALLAAIDSTIRAFSPDLDPASIVPTRPRKRSEVFKHGELSRLCVDQLRDATGPIAASEIMEALCASKGIEHDRVLTERVLSVMRTMLKRGEVTRQGEAPHVYWSVAQQLTDVDDTAA